MNALLVAAVALLAAGATGAPARSSQPRTYALEAGVSVWDVAIDDVNRDGCSDVYVLCCDEDSYPLSKSAMLFLSGPSGDYPSKPSSQLDLDPSVGVLFLAETNGAPPRELVAADSHGATIYQWNGSAFEIVSQQRFPSLFPTGAKEPLIIREIPEDLDGDGIDEWFIPVPSGYQLRTPTGPLCNVACDVVSEIRRTTSLYVYHRLPARHLFDLEGQQHKGLAFLSDEFADFAYGENWAQHKRFRIPVNLEEKWEASAKMADIDANGLPDLIITQTKGTVNLSVVTHIYMAQAPFTYPDAPSATFEAKGAIASPILRDANGDGSLDLLFIKIPFGVKSFISYFVLHKLNVQVAVYTFDGEHFNRKPDFEQTLVLDAPEGREQVAYTLGDFNGDGLVDVAFGSGAEKMVVHAGVKGKFVTSRPWTVIKLPTFGVARRYDLNGNASEDLILFHPGIEHKERVEVVVF